uniref:ROK family transcriptional regulator n=1 Tax=Fervidobacterium pennivorans TaxID=93466 RepID=A0A7V4KBR9_FERPE
MKENNYSFILRTLYHLQPIERVCLVQQTGLSPSTVTRCIAELIDAGFISEVGTSERTKLGRKPVKLKINPEAFNVLIVDIGAFKTNYALGFSDGTLQKLQSLNTPDSFEEILNEVNKLLNSYKRVEVVAFSIPGMVDVNSSTILFVPSKGWRNIKIEVEGKIVYADNEANLAMISEAFEREEIRSSKCSVFVTVREGFGTGLWINGSIFRGPSFTAGEFGHTTFDLFSKNICHCGNTGCVETYVSLSSFFGENYGFLKSYFSEKDWKQNPKIFEYINLLSRALSNIVNALNPEYIIIGGDLSGIDGEFYEILEEFTKRYSLEHAAKILKVLPSTFITDTYLYGALYAVIEEYLIPNIIRKITKK